MQSLDPLTLPLQGQLLIEASAGTGKTYTIALLFLRLLLEEKFTVDKILVVTFTRAATEELRTRIRQRIRDGLDVLEGRSSDSVLDKLLTNSMDDKQRAIQTLTDALTLMDEAAIFTIHGFCQRMLQEHAFESGAPFEMEFLESEQLLRQRIMEDFWRDRFYGASRDETVWAARQWGTPDALLKSIGGHLDRQDIRCVPDVNDEIIVALEKKLDDALLEVRSQWERKRNTILDQLRENKKISKNKKNGYHPDRLDGAANTLDGLVQVNSLPWQPPEADLLPLFTSSHITASLLKNKNKPPDHPFLDLFDDFWTTWLQLTSFRRIRILLTARQYLHTELTRRKEEHAQLFFNDLLTHLDAALQGEGGHPFARTIGTRFPMILVDEFQDTDPLQYRIFSTIHTRNPESGLILIGDPKQAIYSFRGADIFTYIQARSDCKADNRLTMDTNYRSTSGMVGAVNQLFGLVDNPFLLFQDAMTFTPVKAAGFADKEPLLLGNTVPPPLTCLRLPNGKKSKNGKKGKNGTNDKPANTGVSRECASTFCAQEIGQLLTAGRSGQATIGDRPLQAGDIAVLVRTHREAAQVRSSLGKLRISSVYYSHDSVFLSREAQQIRVVLSGLLDLSDSGMIRSALATPLFGYDAARLDQLHHSEEKWEKVMTVMAEYRQIWQEQGFIPMFQRLLKEQKMVQRIHPLLEGERILTNYLHLAELLQEAGLEQIGPEGLVRWFSNQIQAPEKGENSGQMRLESDENLVKIVTIHKAKGMEYPIVFLPFLWSARICKAKEPFSFHQPDEPDRLYLELAGNSDHLLLAEKERLAEDLRMLYVAVTRARYCCFFCWGRIKGMENSALGYLLHGRTMPEEAELLSALAQLDTDESPLAVKPFIEQVAQKVGQDADAVTELQPAIFQGHIDTSWRITSYSRLTAHPGSQSDRQPEQPDYDSSSDNQSETAGEDRFGFPRGAAAGTCLHAILEHISFTDSADHETIINEQLARAGFEPSWGTVVADWLADILDTGLDENGLRLSGLGSKNRVNEMSFYFPLNGLDLSCFNRVLADFDYAPLPGHDILQGLMVGFIDLVFCHENRYYVADYKSNHLGAALEDYRKLEPAMLEHRYDLQYLIYSLALHRYLQSRIPNYSYNDHFGGAYYLFLRGMQPSADSGVYFDKPPFALIDGISRCCNGEAI